MLWRNRWFIHYPYSDKYMCWNCNKQDNSGLSLNISHILIYRTAV
jgi:hypothetical protein